MPKDGLSFFVKIPEGGIVNPQITVRGEEGFNEPITYTTKGNAKLEAAKRYKLEVPGATKGTAFAKINGEDVKVQWVQLWPNGPKFATHNVGAESMGQLGDEMTWADATKPGAEYVWGANWRTPTKDELAVLSNTRTSTLVKCQREWVDGALGFTYTGLTPGYTNNSLFIPMDGDYDYSEGHYWSSIAGGTAQAWLLHLYGDSCGESLSDPNGFFGEMVNYSKTNLYRLRPVLAE